MIQTTLFNLPATHCRRCGRRLTNHGSMQRGLGPVCAGCGPDDAPAQNTEEFTDFTLFNPITEGLILMRDELGAWTNIPHLVVQHSPSGYEWGYGGSGPADLALNTVEVLLNHLDYSGEREDCYRGTCWAKAFEFHQTFKWEFIATAPKNAAVIPFDTMLAWVANRLKN